MNLYFVHDDGGSSPRSSARSSRASPGARSSILAKDLGHEVEERRVGDQGVAEGVASGAITEVFACGTAAVVTPVGRLGWERRRG